jgi:hypothetical protein
MPLRSKIGVCVQKFQPFFRFSVKSNLHASYKFKTDLDFFLLPTLNFCNNMLLLLLVILASLRSTTRTYDADVALNKFYFKTMANTIKIFLSQ